MPNFLVVPNYPTPQGSASNLDDFLKALAIHPGPVAIDTETNAEDIRDGRGFAMGVSAAYRHPNHGLVSHYLPFRHRYGENLEPHWRVALKEAIEFRDSWAMGPTVFHNSKFDLESLKTLDIKIENTQYTYCTMLMAQLLSEEWPMNKGLDACGKHYLGDEGKKVSPEFKIFVEKVGWGNVPSEMMYEYASYDPDLTLRLFEHLWELWVKEGIDDYWRNSKSKAVDTLRNMERRGIGVDTKRCERMAEMGHWQMEEIKEILQCNPGSPLDLKALLLDELKLPVVKESNKTGRPSFDKEAMEVYDVMLDRLDNPTAGYIKTYRGWQKSVSSNYEPYVKLLSPDGKLRPNYRLHKARTGRLTCDLPNLQNIPRETNKPWNGEMKQCFIEYDDDWELWEADYSQLELRLGAAYGRVESLIEVFADDSNDVFTEMSKRTGMSRYDTKQLAYTMQYGGGIARIMAAFGVSREVAERMRNEFFAAYPEFKIMSDLAARRCKQTGRVQLWSKRYRHFPYRNDQAHKAWNSVLQGGAADIVEQRMNYLERNLDQDRAQMLLQIHDAFVLRVRKSHKQETLAEVKYMMENVEPDFGVKFKVDVHKWPSAA